MDLSKLISDASRKAEASPSYNIHPTHTALVGYAIQMWSSVVGDWVFHECADGIVTQYPFKEAWQRWYNLTTPGAYGEHMNRLITFRVVGICECTYKPSWLKEVERAK